MARKKANKANENYQHTCDEVKIPLADHEKCILQMGFTEDELKELLDMFLFHAPILKNSAPDDSFGLKRLKDFGWTGNKELSKLEGKLLKASGMTVFCMVKSCGKINDTLESMDLMEKICITHPRAVIKWNASVTLNENGTTEISTNESRMECLFRHLRNSLAHNHTYLFDNDNILIEDCDDNGTVSARILMPRKALHDWVEIVKNSGIDKRH